MCRNVPILTTFIIPRSCHKIVFIHFPDHKKTLSFNKLFFCKQRHAEIGEKIKQKLSNTLVLNFCYLRFICFFSSTLSFKHNRKYSKKSTKNKYGCLNAYMWLMTMKMRLKMKNRSSRYDINRPKPRHGHKYTKYKMSQ